MLYGLILHEHQRKMWAIHTADSLWVMATGQRINADAWRPYSEIIDIRPRAKADNRSGAEIARDTIKKLKKYARKGGARQ